MSTAEAADACRLVIVFGPPAVGKRTVGEALARRTGFRLFHNHVSIELALEFFEYGTPGFRSINEAVRLKVFEETAASDLPGVIFTYVWALDDPHDKAYVDKVAALYEARGGSVHFVELRADLERRLVRNRDEERLSAKPSKRDLANSERLLLESEERYRLNTDGDFPYPDRHLVLDNTDLEPDEVARRIAEHFGFPEPG